MSQKDVCIILPALNEELAIGKVIDEIPRGEIEELGYRVDVLVVDGNSTDRTLQVAREKGARILVERRRGKAQAFRTALKTVTADYIFMLDSDFTYPSTHIPDMLEALKDYPVVIGSRLNGQRERGSLRWINFLGNHLLTWLANNLYRTRISDLCTGYWGFRKEVVQALDLTSNGFQLEAELLVETAKKGFQIGEIPISYRSRQGKAKLSGFKDGLKIAHLLISRRFHS